MVAILLVQYLFGFSLNYKFEFNTFLKKWNSLSLILTTCYLQITPSKSFQKNWFLIWKKISMISLYWLETTEKSFCGDYKSFQDSINKIYTIQRFN